LKPTPKENLSLFISSSSGLNTLPFLSPVRSRGLTSAPYPLSHSLFSQPFHRGQSSSRPAARRSPVPSCRARFLFLLPLVAKGRKSRVSVSFFDRPLYVCTFLLPSFSFLFLTHDFDPRLRPTTSTHDEPCKRLFFPSFFLNGSLLHAFLYVSDELNGGLCLCHPSASHRHAFLSSNLTSRIKIN
jgi:hypothetical protein